MMMVIHTLRLTQGDNRGGRPTFGFAQDDTVLQPDYAPDDQKNRQNNHEQEEE